MKTDMRDLARSQQRVFGTITDCWQSTLKECVKIEVNKVQVANQANLALLREVDNVNKETDANILFAALKAAEGTKDPALGNGSNGSAGHSDSVVSGLSKMTLGLTKTHSSSDESSSSSRKRFVARPKNRRAHSPKEYRIELDQLRRISTKTGQIEKANELLVKQDELIVTEMRKQEGFQRLGQSSTSNSDDIQRKELAEELK